MVLCLPQRNWRTDATRYTTLQAFQAFSHRDRQRCITDVITEEVEGVGDVAGHLGQGVTVSALDGVDHA